VDKGDQLLDIFSRGTKNKNQINQRNFIHPIKTIHVAPGKYFPHCNHALPIFNGGFLYKAEVAATTVFLLETRANGSWLTLEENN